MSYTMDIIIKDYDHLFKVVEKNNFDSTYTIAAIARRSNIGSFDSNMEALKALKYFRVLVIKDKQYQIDRRKLLDYLF